MPHSTPVRLVAGSRLLLVCLPLLAACASPRSPASAAPAAAVATPPVERIDSIFAAYRAPGSPGCVLTVMRAGDVVLSRAYGAANRETGEVLSTRTVIDGGSLTKQFTAYAIAMLAAEGRLSLDDDIHRHIPELPAYPHTVTLRHLLNHARADLDLWMHPRAHRAARENSADSANSA
jgi:CubicO group peptidase (beta-lactamase class C family)